MLVYVFITPTYPTSDLTIFAESAVYILHIFANNFGTKRVVFYSKRPISLFFHALSHKTIKIFIANALFSFFSQLQSDLSIKIS